MSTLSAREKAFEDKFKHEEELRFKIEARLVKMAGLWVAEQVDMPAAKAESFALDLVRLNLDEPGRERLVARLGETLEQGGVVLSDHQLQRSLSEFEAEAQRQVMTE
ncbi:DUF1476 domain-containing protein [Kiloniella sp. b19]|uniref:DUF1476 domain-containing protein n=1 Tax=Kiloniella sp. GXU_MW_B19 TaxID=3141326 RepID=UPI0031DBF1FE